MPSNQPSQLRVGKDDFEELTRQLNYMFADVYSKLAELFGLDGYQEDPANNPGYIDAADVTYENLDANGDVGTGSAQVAQGTRGVTNGDTHNHQSGAGAAIAEAALTLADNTTADVSTTKHGLAPKAPNDTTKFLRGDASWAVPVFSKIVNRGDPASSDFTIASFTTDDTWRDLDLSSIVPAGATMVLLRVVVEDDAAESYLQFRKNGNSNIYAVGGIYTQVANVITEAVVPVFCDTSRVIEYRGSNLTFTSIEVNVLGWVL